VTLRERIKSKDLELSETLNIAEQIASALVTAHEETLVGLPRREGPREIQFGLKFSF
jgi:hypothetical protein